ncbi:hypothetical protein [Pseudomonas violetae]|uniref:Uncharacterized protein n=1 Tax=Pseudomonas violetae TaxID=2915813 RepID=A0ABT0EXF6_9PSED|nr:hypothetical protein [Pseudomonas violetae]MCK1790442.1 hypothetical protein [Pseudomonas violetae]
MSNVTDDMAGLNIKRSPSAGPDPEPAPDYDLDVLDNGAAGGNVRSDVPRPTKIKLPKWKEHNPEHNKKHFPEAYADALKMSKEGSTIGPHETIPGAVWMTGRGQERLDIYFDLPVRNRVLRMPDLARRTKDRFGFNV